MNTKFCEKAMTAIQKGIERGDSIAEMEAIGVSQRIINALEESEYCIIYLKQLLERTTLELAVIPNVGVKAINQIYAALDRYHLLEEMMLEDAIV